MSVKHLHERSDERGSQKDAAEQLQRLVAGIGGVCERNKLRRNMEKASYVGGKGRVCSLNKNSNEWKDLGGFELIEVFRKLF